jgi:hypothetical protein
LGFLERLREEGTHRIGAAESLDLRSQPYADIRRYGERRSRAAGAEAAHDRLVTNRRAPSGLVPPYDSGCSGGYVVGAMTA